MPREGSGADLARELGISRQAVHAAEKSGRVSRMASGKFDLDAARIQYNLHTDPEQQRRALAKQSNGATTALATPMGAEDWRIRRERAETERAEVELARIKGTLATVDSISAASARTFYAIVASLTPLPDRVAAECGETDEQRKRIGEVLLRELDRVRSEIADLLEHEPQ